jgi:D-inositol-3-phosphate glycosyltransferase
MVSTRAGMPTPTPLRIVFVLELYPPHVGGVETLFSQLAEGLAAAGHAVTVVTLRLPGTAADEVKNGVRIVRVKCPPFGARYWFSLLGIPVAARTAADADVIHTTTYTAAVPAWVAGRLTRKPVVVTVHEVFGDQWQNLPGLNPAIGFAFRAFEWAVLTLPFARYVCDSWFTRSRLLRHVRCPSGRAAVIYPAVDHDFWAPGRHHPRPLRGDLGLPADTKVYLYFGRPGVSKGIEYLLEAAVRVRAEVPGSRLVMLLARSPADGHARVIRRISAFGLGDHVTVLDPVSRADLPGYLLAADAVVVPSVSEGFGYAATEAAALGCRVVATSGHAVEEVLGGTAVLVPPRNPDALATAIAAAMGTADSPRPLSNRFELAEHVRVVTELYHEVTTRSPDRIRLPEAGHTPSAALPRRPA